MARSFSDDKCTLSRRSSRGESGERCDCKHASLWLDCPTQSHIARKSRRNCHCWSRYSFSHWKTGGETGSCRTFDEVYSLLTSFSSFQFASNFQVKSIIQISHCRVVYCLSIGSKWTTKLARPVYAHITGGNVLPVGHRRGLAWPNDTSLSPKAQLTKSIHSIEWQSLFALFN